MATRTYNPTSAELADAVKTTLEEKHRNDPTNAVSSLEVETSIKAENPSWKVNSKKVSKLVRKSVKEQQKEAATVQIEEDEVSQSSSSSARKLRAIGNSVMTKAKSARFSFKLGQSQKKLKDKPEHIKIEIDVPEEKNDKLLPPDAADDAEDEDEVEVNLLDPVSPKDQPTAESKDNVSTEEKDVEKPPSSPGGQDATTENPEVVVGTEDAPTEPVVDTAMDKPDEIDKDKKVEGSYHDDNDGGKEKCCSDGASCTIM